MRGTDDRANAPLPVTAEVGSEGGSFADLAMQAATFRDNEPRHDRPMHEGHQPAGSEDTTGGMRRYPTEPPPARGMTTRAGIWSAGLVAAAAGAAAGAALAVGLMKRRRSRVD